MGTLFALQSMPHEKRAPLGYLACSLDSQFRHAGLRRGDAVDCASSATTESSSDSSAQSPRRPPASQSSAQSTPDSISSYGNLSNPSQPCRTYLPAVQEPVRSVDVPSWREGVEKEKDKESSAFTLPPAQRQNPRRTGPACRGTGSRHLSPPSTLARQPERRHCFVSSLVIFAAGLIAAIWPLSAPVLHDTTYAHNVLPLQDFITETLRRSKTSYSTLQIAMYYLILLKDHLPRCNFSQEQSCVPSDRRAMQCGRRMFLSALMLASKFLQDRNYSTRAWGKITGLPTSEINTNELKFLEAVDWELHVSKEKFERWSRTVITLSAPPKPGMSLIPQPSVVETLGWSAVLGRLTPDCRDDFAHFRDGTAIPGGLCDQTESNGMLTPPCSPPDSTAPDHEEPINRSDIKHDPLNVEASNEPTSAYLAPPPAPHQQNLPTPSSTPRLPHCSSLPRTGKATRCHDSSSAMAMLKLCARPANRTLCPPPSQRPCPRPDQLGRPSISRRSSISSSSSNFSSPESLRSDLSGFAPRSRSSSISSVASSILAPFQGSDPSESLPEVVQQPACLPDNLNLPKVDCSSKLRSEEYSAADALLRFYESRQSGMNKQQASAPHSYSTMTELARRSKQPAKQPSQSATSTEKKKKKRTHSKTNMSDLVNCGGDDLQSLVRKDLMTPCDDIPAIVIPDVDPVDPVGRQSKRNRCGKEQLSAVDRTRILMRETHKENRPMTGKHRRSNSNTVKHGRDV
jgi:Cyclin